MTRTALVAPGAGYGLQAPLVDYSLTALERRDVNVTTLTWDPVLATLPNADRPRWACEQVAAKFEDHDVMIGKSLGSNASPIAADHGIPAVWLTPVLTWPWAVDGMRRATAPFLLVGGTADRLWDGALARTLTPHVLEIDGADHGLMVPGPLADSATVLGQVATAVEEFLDTVVWPA